MKLRGIEFGPILGASGVEGFFGEGYPYHRYFQIFPGFDFEGMTLVAKTITLDENKGRMPLKDDRITPREWKPHCIEVSFWKAIAVNAVGLSNPGAKFLFEQDEWQRMESPFFLSFMSIQQTVEARLEELRKFVEIFSSHLPEFQAPVGLQINFSCPNVGLHSPSWDEKIDEVNTSLDIAGSLDIPLMPKFNILLPVQMLGEIVEHKHCDGICVSNTIPWGELSDRIDWPNLFGSDMSPLAQRGLPPGGLSGAPLLPLVCEWVKTARRLGMRKPINAGGGILKPDDVSRLKDAGASSVFIGSVVMLRPWRVKSIIKRAHELF